MRSGCWHGQVKGDSSPDLEMVAFLLCPHREERAVLWHKDTNPVSEPHPYDSFSLSYMITSAQSSP